MLLMGKKCKRAVHIGIPNPTSMSDHAHQQQLFSQSAAASTNCLAMSQAMITGMSRQQLLAEQQIAQLIERGNRTDPHQIAALNAVSETGGGSNDAVMAQIMKLLGQISGTQ